MIGTASRTRMRRALELLANRGRACRRRTPWADQRSSGAAIGLAWCMDLRVGEADHASVCDECSADLPVQIPERLVQDCVKGRLLLFVGSGASTESHNVMPRTFYDRISDGITNPPTDAPFPDLMEAYVDEHSRPDLIVQFFERMRYIERFPELHRRATRFHRAVAGIPYFEKIITTNWDDYFEREAGAIPLVSGEDFAYWDLPYRQVLKIHGSSQNPGSMVATRTEYDQSLKDLRSGALGTTARHLIATRSIVFVGYSLRDDDIRDVIIALRSDLGQAARKVYFVHPSPTYEPPLDDAVLINTSAASFIEQLDDVLVECGALVSLKMYDRLGRVHRRLKDARLRFDDALPPWKAPLEIYNHAYQDGFDHALQKATATARYGTDRLPGQLHYTAHHYMVLEKEARAARDDWNVAYIVGYLNGLVSLFADEFRIDELPLYYCPGWGEETSFARVAKAVRAGAATHKRAYLKAKRIAEDQGEGILTMHTPFL